MEQFISNPNAMLIQGATISDLESMMLRVSLVTLDNWTKLGIINARRIGTRVYYTDKDINDALKKVSK